MNGPIATGSGVLVCCLKGVFLFFSLFTHSCVKNCIDLSLVKTELLKMSFFHDIYLIVLAPVVQMSYSAINRINRYPVDKWILTTLSTGLRFIQWIGLSTF